MSVHLLGWIGVALTLLSYAQRNPRTLRQVALAGGCVLIMFNIAIGVWVNVALEASLLALNTRRLLEQPQPEPQPGTARRAHRQAVRQPGRRWRMTPLRTAPNC